MHFLSVKSARQCLTKKNCNTMRTGGCYSQDNLLLASSSASMLYRFVANLRERAKLMGGACERALLF